VKFAGSSWDGGRESGHSMWVPNSAQLGIPSAARDSKALVRLTPFLKIPYHWHMICFLSIGDGRLVLLCFLWFFLEPMSFTTKIAKWVKLRSWDAKMLGPVQSLALFKIAEGHPQLTCVDLFCPSVYKQTHVHSSANKAPVSKWIRPSYKLFSTHLPTTSLFSSLSGS
jgi:hypothetical protein